METFAVFMYDSKGMLSECKNDKQKIEMKGDV